MTRTLPEPAEIIDVIRNMDTEDYRIARPFSSYEPQSPLRRFRRDGEQVNIAPAVTVQSAVAALKNRFKMSSANAEICLASAESKGLILILASSEVGYFQNQVHYAEKSEPIKPSKGQQTKTYHLYDKFHPYWNEPEGVFTYVDDQGWFHERKPSNSGAAWNWVVLPEDMEKWHIVAAERRAAREEAASEERDLNQQRFRDKHGITLELIEALLIDAGIAVDPYEPLHYWTTERSEGKTRSYLRLDLRSAQIKQVGEVLGKWKAAYDEKQKEETT